MSSSPGGRCISSSTGWLRTSGCAAGQRRLDPLEQRLLGGCHLIRPIVDLLTTAGFSIVELYVFYEKGAPKFAGADSLGTALSP